MTSSDVVVGVFSRDQLSGGLVEVHRAGLGPMARVLDPGRGDLDAQMRRTGYEIAASFAGGDPDTMLLFLTAPGRTERATEVLRRAGAHAVYQARRAVPAAVPAAERPVALDDHRAPPASAIEG